MALTEQQRAFLEALRDRSPRTDFSLHITRVLSLQKIQIGDCLEWIKNGEFVAEYDDVKHRVPDPPVFRSELVLPRRVPPSAAQSRPTPPNRPTIKSAPPRSSHSAILRPEPGLTEESGTARSTEPTHSSQPPIKSAPRFSSHPAILPPENSAAAKSHRASQPVQSPVPKSSGRDPAAILPMSHPAILPSELDLPEERGGARETKPSHSTLKTPDQPPKQR